MKTKCVIYSRVSTDLQSNESAIQDLHSWANTMNMEVVKVFAETISGFKDKRSELESLKAYIKNHNIKHILCFELSRIGRSTLHTLKEIDYFRTEGVNIHLKKEGINTLSNDATTKLLLSVLSSVSELEVSTFKERSKRGMKSAVLKGKPVFFSTNPYGYTTDENGIIAIEENEAKVVKMMFQMAIRGDTLYSIAQHLNSLEVPTRLKKLGRKRKYLDGSEGETKWTPTTVTRVLKRTLYKGVRIYKDLEIPVPAIVSEDDWNKVQQRFADNIGYLNNTKHKYLFKSKIRCGRCKRMITTHIIRRKNSRDTLYYECEGYKKVNNPCPDKRISLSIELVDKSLYEVLFNHKYIKEIMAIESSQALQKEDKIKQLEYFQSEINDLGNKGRRLKKLYADGHYTYEEFQREIGSVNNLVTGIENKISVIKNELITLEKIDPEEIIETYKASGDYNIKREFILKYVNEVNMYRIDGANVKWDKPLRKDEKIIYFEVYAFNFRVPLKILITPHSKNVLVSGNFQYLPDYNIVSDISQNP